MSKRVVDFSFEDMGVNSPSYFQGAGVAYTNWDEVFVGVGDTAREAADDAMSNLMSSDVKLSSNVIWGKSSKQGIDAAVVTFDDEASAHDDCDFGDHDAQPCDDPDCEAGERCNGHDECELQHYVALYVRYAEEPEHPVDAYIQANS